MKTLKFENPKADGYRDLVVWQKGIAVAKLVYALTKTFPTDEKFGLISQMRRAAVSVSSNIAEGQARHTTGEFIQFISHAEGSVAELDTQLHLAVELGFATEQQAATCFALLGEPRRMLNGLRRKLSGPS
jgi:four helix bundle protein